MEGARYKHNDTGNQYSMKQMEQLFFMVDIITGMDSCS